MDKRRVLFICTGNSCRSQLAEAMVNHDFADSWIAYSAGTVPAGYIHPLTLKVLKEIGIDHQGLSKSVEQFRNNAFDLVITVCDDAAENCPVWLGKGKRLHIGFLDPAKVAGPEEEVITAFRQVRDDIRHRISTALEEYEQEAALSH